MLKNLRKEKGWTQSQVANYLNLSKTGYASWEQALAEPNIENIKKLCMLYDVTADYLLELVDEWGNKLYNTAKPTETNQPEQSTQTIIPTPPPQTQPAYIYYRSRGNTGLPKPIDMTKEEREEVKKIFDKDKEEREN